MDGKQKSGNQVWQKEGARNTTGAEQSVAMIIETRPAKCPAILLDQLKQLAVREHYQGDDCWYSCHKSEEGSCNDSNPQAARELRCSCGADAHNAKVEEVYQQLKMI